MHDDDDDDENEHEHEANHQCEHDAKAVESEAGRRGQSDEVWRKGASTLIAPCRVSLLCSFLFTDIRVRPDAPRLFVGFCSLCVF